MASPNIIWITLDSVRYDHTSLAGYDRETTPNLQQIAQEGVSYSNCYSEATFTLPTTASILTGTYPSRHQVGFGGNSLGEDLPTLPELFAECGYTTACLSRNSYLSSATRLNRGFDRFKWIGSSSLATSVKMRTLAKYFFNLRRHSAGFQRNTAKHATPYIMNDIAKRWIRQFRSTAEPFFFYLHYNEPHRPYYPPLPYLDRYTGEIEMSTREAAEFAMEVHYNLEEYIASGLDFTQRQWDALLAMYDAEIAYTDAMIGRLFRYVTSSGVGDTVFVITSDHGELFGEQGMLGHKVVLSDPIVHVPLVVNGIDYSSDSSNLVQHVDIVRTLADSIGADSATLQGLNVRDETREFVISQRGDSHLDSITKHNDSFDTSRYHETPVSALRTHEYKYLQSDTKEELFELPDEENDISTESAEVLERFRSLLQSWLETEGQAAGTVNEAEFSGAMKQQLRDLGYID